MYPYPDLITQLPISMHIPVSYLVFLRNLLLLLLLLLPDASPAKPEREQCPGITTAHTISPGDSSGFREVFDLVSGQNVTRIFFSLKPAGFSQLKLQFPDD